MNKQEIKDANTLLKFLLKNKDILPLFLIGRKHLNFGKEFLDEFGSNAQHFFNIGEKLQNEYNLIELKRSELLVNIDFKYPEGLDAARLGIKKYLLKKKIKENIYFLAALITIIVGILIIAPLIYKEIQKHNDSKKNIINTKSNHKPNSSTSKSFISK